MESRLTILNKDPSNGRYSICQCSCGIIKSIKTYKVNHNIVLSCGCYSEELASIRLKGKAGIHCLPPGVSGLNKLYSEYKRIAKRKNRVFELSKEIFKKLTSSDCYYCGIAPYKFCYQGRAMHLAYSHNGIDRVNNEMGYLENNCVPCCEICNFGKRTMTSEAYIEHCRKVSKKHEKSTNIPVIS